MRNSGDKTNENEDWASITILTTEASRKVLTEDSGKIPLHPYERAMQNLLLSQQDLNGDAYGPGCYWLLFCNC